MHDGVVRRTIAFGLVALVTYVFRLLFFSHCVRQLVIHASMAVSEYYLIFVDTPRESNDTETFFDNTANCWFAPGTAKHSLNMKMFYVVQLSIWIVTCFSHRFVESRHKDYYQMCVRACVRACVWVHAVKCVSSCSARNRVHLVSIITQPRLFVALHRPPMPLVLRCSTTLVMIVRTMLTLIGALACRAPGTSTTLLRLRWWRDRGSTGSCALGCWCCTCTTCPTFRWT